MKLFTWGANSNGQLSHGCQTEQCLQPIEASSLHQLEDVEVVSAGGGHTLLLDSEKNVYGTGNNCFRQVLRDEHVNCVTTLIKIEDLERFKPVQVECGWDSSFALTSAGDVVVWGSNTFSQLGLPTKMIPNATTPVAYGDCVGLEPLPEVVQVSAGLRHTALVSRQGLVYVSGQGRKGQLGLVNSENKFLPHVDRFVEVKGLEGVVQVACGQHHTLALTRHGQLLGWGDNRRGQLGPGDICFPTPRLIMTGLPQGTLVRAGWTHSAVLTDGHVISWGRNNYGQLGHSPGCDQVCQPQQVTGLQSIKQLVLGSEHNLALSDSGEVFSWGWNEHGNCGLGTVENVMAPQHVSVPYSVSLIAAGAGHSLAFCAT